MRKFLTNEQVVSYLVKQAEENGITITGISQRDIEYMLLTRPWFIEFELIDGRLVLSTLTSEEFMDLERINDDILEELKDQD